jgi:GTP-binding protein
MFTDRVTIELHAGKGGNGVVAWRREKYIPKGGPYGGDGGVGGSIIFEADPQVYSLEAYRNRRILKAENGREGGANNRKGKNGHNLLLKIPCGTLIKDAETGDILFDVTTAPMRIEICTGGKGGRGNSHFKSPTNRAPNYCTPGKPGISLEVELELKLIADVGLVGFPNAGKSTFLSRATNVDVKIAPYPFTTLKPNLGYTIDSEGGRILIADIPGIIAGAHQDRGLGLEFLRHIERTHILLFILDASGFEGRDPIEDFSILQKELALYNPDLLTKPFAVLLNKIDHDGAQTTPFRHKYPSLEIFEISALTGQGLNEVTGFLKRKLSK